MVTIYGAQGSSSPSGGPGGNGAYIVMNISNSFHPLQTMYVTVGGHGNGFGNPGQAGVIDSKICPDGVGAGGGYSALYDTNFALIAIAGGGGGGGSCE